MMAYLHPAIEIREGVENLSDRILIVWYYVVKFVTRISFWLFDCLLIINNLIWRIIFIFFIFIYIFFYIIDEIKNIFLFIFHYYKLNKNQEYMYIYFIILYFVLKLDKNLEKLYSDGDWINYFQIKDVRRDNFAFLKNEILNILLIQRNKYLSMITI